MSLRYLSLFFFLFVITQIMTTCGQFYVFYRAETYNDLRYAEAGYQLNQLNWNKFGFQVANRTNGITYGPSVVEYNELIYIFHQGGSDNSLWYTTYDGTNWVDDTQVANVATTGAPSLVVSDNILLIFHQGGGDGGYYDNELWLSGYDQNNNFWVPDTQIQGITLNYSPSAVLFNHAVYVFFALPLGWHDTSNAVFYFIWNGTLVVDEDDVQTIPNLGTNNSPATVEFQGYLYVFVELSGGLWYTRSTDAVNWDTPSQISGVGISDAPNAVVINCLLYVFYQGSDGALGWSTFVNDQVGWSSYEFDSILLTDSPSAVWTDF